jgi:hypothetical protein
VSDYRVYRGDVLLGAFTMTGSDMPWWKGQHASEKGAIGEPVE